MRRSSALVAALVAVAAAPAGARAACAPTPPNLPPAPVVLDAVALSGPAAPDGSLGSPARLRVLSYVTGRGPRSLRLTTGTLLAFHGVVGSVSEAPTLRAGRVVRLRLRGRDVRDLRAGRVLAGTLCGDQLGRPRAGRLRTVPRSETVAEAWRARVLRAVRGVRCLRLRGRTECAVMRRRTSFVLNRRVADGHTALSAWGPRLRRVVVTRVGGEPIGAASGRRPPLFVFDGAVEAFDLRVELFFDGGARRIVQGDVERRVFAADPLTGGRWTAYSADVDGERCAVFDPLGFAGISGDTCRSGAPDGFFATDARDPAGQRVIVYGVAGARIARLVVAAGESSAEVPRARRGGAFLAIVRGPVDPAGISIAVWRTDGTVSTFTGQASGTF